MVAKSRVPQKKTKPKKALPKKARPQWVFSPGGEKKLNQWFATKPPLLCFDYDGTLAPLGDDPEKVWLPSETLQRLRRLAACTDVVIVSGRSYKDLRRLKLGEFHLIGNHGMDFFQSTKDLELVQRVAKWRRLLAHQLEALDPRVFIENKVISLSIHFRGARNPRVAKTAIIKTIVGLGAGVKVIYGKDVINVLPTSASTKGVAVLKAMKILKYSRAFFIGDDVTDEHVFAMGDPRIFGVRVGFGRRTEALYALKGQGEIHRLLGKLEQLVRPESTPTKGRKEKS